MKRKQFLISIKREWKELIRTRRILVYVFSAIGILAACWLLSTSTVSVSDSTSTTTYALNSRYGMIGVTNKLLISVYLFVCLLFVRPLITDELEGKKLVQPLCMGLKPGVHLASKYVVQILVPAIIGFFASLINGIIAVLVYPRAAVSLGYIKIAYVSMGDVVLSSLCVMEVIVFFLLILMSLTAIMKNSSIPFALCIVILLFGSTAFEKVGIIFFSPFVFQEYAEKLYIEATITESMLASFVTIAIWALMTILSIMLYDDRADMSMA